MLIVNRWQPKNVVPSNWHWSIIHVENDFFLIETNSQILKKLVMGFSPNKYCMTMKTPQPKISDGTQETKANFASWNVLSCCQQHWLSSTMSPLLKILNFKAGCYEKRFKESRKWTQDLKNWKQAQRTKQRLKQKLVSIWGEVKAEERGRVFLHTLCQLTHNIILDIGTAVPILPMRKHTHDNMANLGWSWDLPSDLSHSLASSHVTYPLSSPWN